MKITLVFVLIAILNFLTLSTPSAAQYYSGNGGAYQNAGTRTGFGGSQGNDSGGFQSLASTSSMSGHRSSQSQVSESPSTMQNLERALDAIDSPKAWPQAMVSVPPARSSQANSYGSAATSAPGGMFPRVTRRDIARVMMEGGSLFDGAAGSASIASSGQASRAQGATYSSYQRAENMATRARNAANRVRYDKDKWSKKKSADEAYYDANSAAAAADSAYASAASGDSQARGYARLARAAANRARADADRARYNANTAY